MNPNSTVRHVVVKVGGSLFRDRDAFQRAVEWLHSHSDRLMLVVSGGGALADVIRQIDSELKLGDELAHDLSIETMRLNQKILHSRFDDAPVLRAVDEISNCPVIMGPVFFDVGPWHGTARLGPHNWDTTSDSIAAALAVESGAAELVLLKRTGPLGGQPAAEPVFCPGWVDNEFVNWAVRLPAIRVVDLGQTPWVEWTRSRENGWETRSERKSADYSS